MMFDIVTQIFVFLFGICIGSFLNVLIYRLPRDENVVRGRSHCVSCGTMIPWYDNIPLVSYWLLRGKCRFCKASFSFRYFLVELLTGLVWLFLWRYYGFTGYWISTVILFSLLIAVTFTDLETGYIPDLLNFPGMILGLLLSAIFPFLFARDIWYLSLWKSFLGLLMGGGTLLSLGVLGQWIFKKEAMGGGDIKLLAFLGAFLGIKKVMLVIFIAPFFALPFAVYTRFIKKSETFPFGPFIVMAAVWTYFCGDVFLQRTFYL